MMTPAAAPVRPDARQLAADVAVLQTAVAECKDEVVESDVFIDLLWLATISRTHGFVSGTGGIGKSFAIRTMCARLGANFYYNQLRRDMPLEAIAGPISPKGMIERDVYEHVTTDTLLDANVALLDEFLDAGTMLLRALLGIMFEREFRNGRQVLHPPLWSLFGASNFWPEDPQLQALADRFAWRFIQEPVRTSEGFKRVLDGQIARYANSGISPGAVTVIDADALERLQIATSIAEVPQDIKTVIDELRRNAETEGIFPSVRRIGEGVKIAQASATRNGRPAVIEEDLVWMRYVLPTNVEDFAICAQLTTGFAGKVAQAVAELAGTLEPLHARVESIRTKLANGADADQAVMNEITEVRGPLRKVSEAVEKKIAVFAKEGRDVGDLERIKQQAEGDVDVLRRAVFG
jgi:MoxR-like ATPase